MKFPESWLRTLVDPPLGTRALADTLTMAGLEVEAVEAVAPGFSGVVVAEVLSVAKHPDADRLSLTKVDAGGAAPLDIVCGASNVRAGMRVPCATVGAKLPGIEIKRAKVRGVESHGMLCSAKELGLAADAAGLLELPADAPVGTDIRRYLNLDDAALTLKLTPNRSDCLSIAGIAREVGALTGAPVREVVAVTSPVAATERREVALEAPHACPRYCGRVIRGVNAQAPTPRWMVERLERCGLRSISAIVDVTNYVLLELGQPLHAFDNAKLQGPIAARLARPSESIVLLNEQTVKLDERFLVIADARGPVALAGIMGGATTAVDGRTTDIFLESAYFDPRAIAGRSRMLGFGSDSSYRFERGVDFAGTVRALERATHLIMDICGGAAGPVSEACDRLPQRVPVRLRTARAQRVLGIGIGADRVGDILRRLQLPFEQQGDTFTVTPPSYRFDIAIEEDLIEEIARVHGYENVPAAVPTGGAAMLPASEVRRGADDIRRLLAARDYHEAVTFSFVDEQWERDFAGNDRPVRLANPIASQMSVMRSGMVGSLVDAARRNLSYRQERIRLFEVGRCFLGTDGGYEQPLRVAGIATGMALPEQWGVPGRAVDFYDVKADVEALLHPRMATFEPAAHPAFHPGQCARVVLQGKSAGFLGALHPRWCQKYEMPVNTVCFELNLDQILECQRAAYREVARFPTSRRDVAVVVADSLPVDAILCAAREAAPGYVTEVALFDVYRGKGIDSDKKSLAFRILMQDTRGTLTEADVEAAVSGILKALQEKFDASLRK